jgi:uncharacterized membrane protein HdeD (DUF308 family)
VSEHAATPQFAPPSIHAVRDSVRTATGYWWVLLVAGIAWVAVALVILQFDQASVTTVGILVGLMFLTLGIENIALSTLDVPARWAWALFGGLFLVSAIVCFANPEDGAGRTVVLHGNQQRRQRLAEQALICPARPVDGQQWVLLTSSGPTLIRSMRSRGTASITPQRVERTTECSVLVMYPPVTGAD